MPPVHTVCGVSPAINSVINSRTAEYFTEKSGCSWNERVCQTASNGLTDQIPYYLKGMPLLRYLLNAPIFVIVIFLVLLIIFFILFFYTQNSCCGFSQNL